MRGVAAWGCVVVLASCGRFGFDGRDSPDADAAPTPIDAALADAAAAGCRGSPDYVAIGSQASTYHEAGELGDMSFDLARQACINEGAHLIVTDTRSEATEVFAGADFYYWVGITDVAVEGTFVSVLGQDMTEVVAVSGGAVAHDAWWFAPNQPDGSGDCVSYVRGGLDPTNRLDDADCAGDRYVICECE